MVVAGEVEVLNEVLSNANRGVSAGFCSAFMALKGWRVGPWMFALRGESGEGTAGRNACGEDEGVKASIAS